MTHRCGHPYFRSKFAARLLPTFPDSASTAENAITTCGNAGPAFSIWLVLNPELGQLQDGGDAFRRWQRRLLSYRRGHRNRSLATSQLRSRNSGRYSRQSTALIPRAQDARLNDGDLGPRHQQGFLRLPPPPHFSSQQQNAVPTTAMVPANQNMRHGHTTGGNDPHGRHPGTHRSTP